MKRILLLVLILSSCYPSKNIQESVFTYNKDLGGREGVFSYRFLIQINDYNLDSIFKLEINGFEISDFTSYSQNGKFYIEGVVYPSNTQHNLYKDLSKRKIELPMKIYTKSRLFKIKPTVVRKQNRNLQ
jgi:hypothetical protein